MNGVPSCLNHKLLTEILRDEWNFEGFVISDDDALEFAVTQHHYLPNYVEAAAAAVKAGCNLELEDGGVKNSVFYQIPQVRMSRASCR